MPFFLYPTVIYNNQTIPQLLVIILILIYMFFHLIRYLFFGIEELPFNFVERFCTYVSAEISGVKSRPSQHL